METTETMWNEMKRKDRRFALLRWAERWKMKVEQDCTFHFTSFHQKTKCKRFRFVIFTHAMAKHGMASVGWFVSMGSRAHNVWFCVQSEHTAHQCSMLNICNEIIRNEFHSISRQARQECLLMVFSFQTMNCACMNDELKYKGTTTTTTPSNTVKRVNK